MEMFFCVFDIVACLAYLDLYFASASLSISLVFFPPFYLSHFHLLTLYSSGYGAHQVVVGVLEFLSLMLCFWILVVIMIGVSDRTVENLVTSANCPNTFGEGWVSRDGRGVGEASFRERMGKRARRRDSRLC